MTFYFFSWPSLISDSTERKTPAALSPMIRSILRLWCHESCRTYSDRLFTEEQRYWFSSLLHDSVEEFFCRDNSEQGSEMFTVEQVEMEQKSLRGNWTFHSLKKKLQYSLSLSIHCLQMVIYRVDSESNEKRIRSKHKRKHASSFANSKKHKCKNNDHKELIFELRWRNTNLAYAIQRAH